MNSRKHLGAILLAVGLSLPASARVVINEIFYRAPADLNELQWVELHNPDPQIADLSGWSLAKGIQLQFPAGTRIPAGGFLVVCRNAEVFKNAYHQTAAAVFPQGIKSKSARIELRNARGETVDNVKFDNHSPWPVEADGHSASLERISPLAGSEGSQNWAASPLTPGGEQPGGTPGATNSVFQRSLPPLIHDPQLSSRSVAPGTPVQVSARIEAPEGVQSVALAYRVLSAGKESPEQRIPLQLSANGRYSATLPGEAAGSLGVIRVRLEATDKLGAVRSVPAVGSLRPGFSILVHTNFVPGTIPLVFVLNPALRAAQTPNGQPSQDDMLRWGFQRKFQTDADLYSLWSSLALTNSLDPGQIAKLRPLFTASFEERNTQVREMLETDSPSTRQAAVEATIRRFRSETATALRPALNAIQQKRLEEWQVGPPAPPTRGFDPVQLLKSWVNLEMQYFVASMSPQFSPEKSATIREVFVKAIEQRDGLREMARTAFTDNDSRQAFQGKVEALQQSIQDKAMGLLTDAERSSFQKFSDEALMFRQRRSEAAQEAPAQGRSALVWVDPRTREPQLYDFVDVVERKAGWKVHLHRDQAILGMTVLNLIYEFNDRFVLAEPLSFDLYRRVGNAASLVDFVRLQMDGQPLGYHLLCEQPNKAFLRRNGLPDDGNLYKLGWQGQTLAELYEKKTHPKSGHGDLEELVKLLHVTEGHAQWEVIKKHFNVEQVMTYFAVNSLLAHWDGFMNNYFFYHDLNGSGKWELYPWDQDKAMGFHDAIQGDDVFTTLPLNYGANGDVPPGWKNPKPPAHFFETIRRPGMEWWRQPGYISGPLLANPEFRRLYVARIKQLLGTEFTEEKMVAAINALGARLTDEVRIRAEIRGDDPQVAKAGFEQNLDSLRRFVKGRRAYLLAQSELKNAPPYDRSQLK